MTPEDVRFTVDRLAQGQSIGPNELRNLAQAAMCGAIVEHLARTPVPLAAEMRQIESVARHHLQGARYVAD